MKLTTKESRVIRALQREGGPITAYYLYDYAGVVRTDIVCGNLIKKGLVRYGKWIKGNCEVEGYEVHLTDEGAALVV